MWLGRMLFYIHHVEEHQTCMRVLFVQDSFFVRKGTKKMEIKVWEVEKYLPIFYLFTQEAYNCYTLQTLFQDKSTQIAGRQSIGRAIAFARLADLCFIKIFPRAMLSDGVFWKLRHF